MSEPEGVTLAIAEELDLFRDGLARICETNPTWRVVAHSGVGSSFAETVRRLQPDIALIDLGLSDLLALELVVRFRMWNLPTRSIVLSVRRDRRTVFEALRAGASGFVLKSEPAGQLESAIETVSAGGVYIAPMLNLADVMQQPSTSSCGDPATDLLSAREYQVFTLLIDGVRAKEIAARLDLSPKTVDTYRASLMRKLDIHDVAGLVKFAIQRELIPSR